MPNFRHRLTRAQQREYDRSNAVSAIPLRVSPRLQRAVTVLQEALLRDGGDRALAQRAAQAICDEVCGALHVPPAQVVVKGVRPSNQRGELHGLFSTGPRQGHRIELWMQTAKLRRVVAFKTFLRTLVHEICHHLDYALLRLGDSFHTDGFFKRESSLVHQLVNVPGPTAPARPSLRVAPRE